MSERPDFDEPLPDDIEDDEDDIEYIEGKTICLPMPEKISEQESNRLRAVFMR